MTGTLPNTLILRCQKDSVLCSRRGKPHLSKLSHTALAHPPLDPQSTFFNQLFHAPSPLTPLSPTYGKEKTEQNERSQSPGTATGSFLKNSVSPSPGTNKYTCMRMRVCHTQRSTPSLCSRPQPLTLQLTRHTRPNFPQDQPAPSYSTHVPAKEMDKEVHKRHHPSQAQCGLEQQHGAMWSAGAGPGSNQPGHSS